LRAFLAPYPGDTSRVALRVELERRRSRLAVTPRACVE
jgi:hypothetical protein